MPATSKVTHASPAPLPRGTGRRAFTLVELLVVIGIVIVIYSFLIPALWWAKENGKRVSCQSNHHQLAIGALQYAHNNRGVLINPMTMNTLSNSVFPGVAPWVGSNNDYYSLISGTMWPYINGGNAIMVNGAAVIAGFNSTQIAAVDAAVALSPPKNISLYVCPSDFVETNIRTYSGNSFLNGWEGGGLPYVARLDSVKRPAETFYFIDEFDTRGYNMNGFEVNAYPNTSWIDVPGRFHFSGNDISFADGHVEWWKWLDPVTLSMQPGDINRSDPLPSNSNLPNYDLARMQRMVGSQPHSGGGYVPSP